MLLRPIRLVCKVLPPFRYVNENYTVGFDRRVRGELVTLVGACLGDGGCQTLGVLCHSSEYTVSEKCPTP